MLENLDACARESGVLAAEATIAAAAVGAGGQPAARAAAELSELCEQVLRLMADAASPAAVSQGRALDATGKRRVQDGVGDLLAQCERQIAQFAPAFGSPLVDDPSASDDTARRPPLRRRGSERDEPVLVASRDIDWPAC